MKGILISTRPEWVIKIITGIKRDEIRKGSSLYKAINKLIAEQGVAPTFIYCTKNNKQGLVFDSEGKGLVNSKLFPYAKNCPEHNRLINGKVVARFNATADLLELKMIEGGLYFTTPDRDCFTPNLDLNENAQMDNWQLLRYTGEKLGTRITDIHITNLEIFDKPKDISEFHKVDESWGFICYNCPHFYTDDSAGYSIDGCDLGFENCEKTRLTRAPHSWCYVEE